MPRLPVISGERMVKSLRKIGYAVDHQIGSHIILRHKEKPYRRLTIPKHKELSKGTLRAIIRQAGLNRKEFLNLL